MTVTSAANRVRLHGRDGEVALVEHVLRRVSAEGNAGAIIVKGAAGIGKTALLDTLAERATGAGFSVVRSKADESHLIAPMAPLLLALRSGSSPVLSREAFESLASYRNHPLWLIDRIVGVIEDHASKKPLLIALDDVQWADRLTLSCLRIMPPRLAGLPIVWAIASRDPGPPLPLAESADSQALEIHRIQLEPLGDAAIERIAADRLGVEPASALRQQLKHAAGNPFFAVEIVDGLSDTISKTENGMLPARLRERIARRVSSLSPEARTLVRLGSVLGTPFTVEDLRATSGLSRRRCCPRSTSCSPKVCFGAKEARSAFATISFVRRCMRIPSRLSATIFMLRFSTT